MPLMTENVPFALSASSSILSCQAEEYEEPFGTANSSFPAFGFIQKNVGSKKPSNHPSNLTGSDGGLVGGNESPINEPIVSCNISPTAAHGYGVNGNRNARLRFLGNSKAIGASRLPRHETKL